VGASTRFGRSINEGDKSMNTEKMAEYRNGIINLGMDIEYSKKLIRINKELILQKKKQVDDLVKTYGSLLSKMEAQGE
jgi:hypothetical protein